MADIVNTGATANDGSGDQLRTAFISINERFQQLLGTLSQITWAPGLAIEATPARQWTVVAGQAYVAASNHIAGATFADDLAAGFWLAVDVTQVLADLASHASGKGAAMVATDAHTFSTVAEALASIDWVEQQSPQAVNVLRYIPAAEWPAIVARTSTTDLSAYLNAANTAVLGAGGHLHYPAGLYRVGADVVFPNTSWIVSGQGPTLTTIKPLASTPGVNVFNLTGCNGPAKVIRDFNIEGPSTGVYGTGSAVKCSGTNGLLIDNVWTRGIRYGLEIGSSSFINTRNWVAEYCFIGAKVDNALDESIWVATTCYRNETDIQISGIQKTFEVRGINCIATLSNCIVLLGSGAVVRGVTAQDDGSGYAPNIINIVGSNNRIDGVKSTDFGARGVFFQSASATGNRVTAVDFEGVPKGIEASAASGNTVSDFSIRNSSNSGIRVDSCSNKFSDFSITGCGYGVSMNAADMTQFLDGAISGSTSADWHQTATNTGRLILDNVVSNSSGISGVEYLMTIMPSGNYLMSRSTVPVAAYPFTVGDRAWNTAPAVGQPKGWICTVSGSPGTWVSEGNL